MSAIKPSIPKGTRDFLPEKMYKRQQVIGTIKDTFEKYGYAPLETPSIEKLKVLSGKYGDEGEKLLFKVLKRGTGLENLLKEENEFVVSEYDQLVEEALRYDLTVPLSRVVAMYQNELTMPFKRYQIQPVWRADRPQKGRYREFYQCDIDTVGTESMLADAESLAIVDEILRKLGFTKFVIRLNNRKLLNGILEYSEISGDQSVSAMIAIDKMDKIGLDGVRKELEGRSISAQSISKLLSVMEFTGTSEETFSFLSKTCGANVSVQTGISELDEIANYTESLGMPQDSYKIDLYLVRGLGYYTGPIYESVVEEPKIGSLTGGGRYDKLIGMFSGNDIPATGTAFGIERIIDVMEQLEMFEDIKTKTKVLVTIFDGDSIADSLAFAAELRKAGIATECFPEAVKMKKQLSYTNKKGIPFCILIGPDEIAKHEVSVKSMDSGEQTTLSRSDAVSFLLKNSMG